MRRSNGSNRFAPSRLGILLIAMGMLWACLGAYNLAPAQTTPGQLAERALAEAPPEPTPVDSETPPATVPLLELLMKGGWLMVPILVMSFLVVAVGIERALGLRRRHVFPRRFQRELEKFADQGNLEPRQAYQLCQRYPSSAAVVVRAMLMKVGRPHAEVENTVREAIQSEADRLYANVRTLNLAAAITPLLGLLGTVWGMIEAFFATANLPIGSNKGQALAEGIYVALVTTFAGLAVAIPAAVLAHVFESRILNLLREVEQTVGALLPQIEQYEGKMRIDHQHLKGPHLGVKSTG